MDDLEERLTTLITQVGQHPPKSIKWRLAMSRLLLVHCGVNKMAIK